MKVIYGIGQVKKKDQHPVLVIGVFDGVHVGHQKLIRQAVRRAKKQHRPCMVMTFSPHPIHVLRPHAFLPLIVSLPHRLQILKELGVDAVLVARFSKMFAQQTPQQFVKHYLVDRIKPVEVWVGDDFRFGHDRSGGIDFFKEEGKRNGFIVHAVSSLKTKSNKVGSSLIRALILDGNLKQASRYLGRPIAVLGKVVRGDNRGKKLGFPTANICLGNLIIPPIGVYAVYVQIGRKFYKGMCNVGHKPSFSKKEKVRIEVHIFNFHRQIYGKEILVQFIQKIRDEQYFPSEELLIAQLYQDKKKVLHLLTSF